MTINRAALALLQARLHLVPPKSFHMGVFRSDGDSDYFLNAESFGLDNACDSVACVIGWAPTLLPEYPPLNREPHKAYSYRVLGVHQYYATTRGEWDWLFSHRWEGIDNSTQGAANRINYYLNHGVPPTADSLWETGIPPQ